MYEELEFTLLVMVPCRVEGFPTPVPALFDTGCEWCMMRASVAEALGYDLAAPANTLMLTRFGAIYGRLERIPLRFVAIDNQQIEIEATWFISADWPGPTVLGWRGCLERFRFGIDPGENWFYFGVL